jgi:hypothetical protein
VGARTKLVDHLRGAVESFGARLPKCTAKSLHKKVVGHLPQEPASALGPLLKTLVFPTERIRDYDRGSESMVEELYPQTGLLRQGHGVRVLTASAVVLTLEGPSRLAKVARLELTRGWCPLPIGREVATPNIISPSTKTGR